MNQAQLLIVNKTSPLPDEMQQLIAVLTEKFGLDAFTARQRLTGQGLGLFAKAPGEKLAKVAALLTDHGVNNWIIEPTPPRFAPLRVRSLDIGDEKMIFQAGEKQVVLERGARVLAVLADLTGNMIQRNLKKLVVQTAYLGAGVAAQLDEDETYKTILQNQPVLDLYLLDDQHGVRQAVRFFAGRYDPNGLGAQKTYSSAGNIDAIVRIAREYAGEFTLHTDFGLSELPGCRLKKLEGEQNPDKTHLTPLTRFGWLMVDLHAKQQIEPKTVAPSVDLVAASAILGAPVAAAIATASGVTLPGFEELAAEMHGSPEPEPAKKSPVGQPLPPPPELKPLSNRNRIRQLLTFAGVGVGGSLFFLGTGGELLASAVGFGVRTGTAPALLSLFFGWLGLRHLRIKRHIENLPTSRVRSVAMGLVEVQGYARRKFALVSPMTHQPCVFYRLRKYRRDDEGRNWKEYSSTDCGPVPFDLEDDTGRLTIDPAGAKVIARHRQEGGPGQGSMVFAAAGVHDPSEKWIEEVIPEGTFIYVTGFAHSKEREGTSLRERTMQALRELKQNRHKMQRYDSDGDGRISEEEWQNAREDVEQRVLQQSLEEKQDARLQQSQVVIGRPVRGSLPFIIAETESETHLTRNYAISSAALAILGLGLGLFALVKLAHFFGGRS